MTDISFELYKVFYHVAKNLSFSEASQKLYISQSAVSQSVRLLEDKLNCSLFNRTTKQVRLTAEGEVLFRHIEQAYNFIKGGERSIEEIHGLKQGEIRIGASDTICKYYLLPFLQKFNRQYPAIKINITNRTSPICIELLRKGSIDAAVVNLPPRYEGQLQVTKLKSLQDVFIAGPAFFHLRDRILGLQELASYPLLMLETKTITREFFDQFLAERGVSLRPEIELGSIDLLIELTKIGLGISFVSREYIERDLTAGSICQLRIKDEIPPRFLGIMTNQAIPLPAAAKKFIDMLK